MNDPGGLRSQRLLPGGPGPDFKAGL
jgi:hypothetical protein